MALLEWGDFTPSRAAKLGSDAGCPYRDARCKDRPKAGSQVLWLNHYRAGSVGLLPEHVHYPITDLVLELPLGPLPEWLAPFDIRLSFILDEVVVWFCNRRLIGTSFHWLSDDMLMLAVICWRKKIAITGSEMAAILLAHGMPERFQARAEREFDFAVSAMVWAGGRKAIKKWRSTTSFHDQWSQAMRLWGR